VQERKKKKGYSLRQGRHQQGALRVCDEFTKNRSTLNDLHRKNAGERKTVSVANSLCGLVRSSFHSHKFIYDACSLFEGSASFGVMSEGQLACWH